jgi:hypothetical protein
MRLRNWRVPLLLLLSVAYAFGSQITINITGKVTNTSQVGIQGAVVKLFTKAMACTTKSDGTYTLSGTSAVLPDLFPSATPGVSYHNQTFLLEVPSPVPASVKLYDLRGRMVATLFSGMLKSGMTAVRCPLERFGKGLLLARIAVGSHEATYPMPAAGRNDFSIAGGTFTKVTTAKSAAAGPVDWIQANKTGYAASVQQLSSYTGVVNFTLNAPAAPNFGTNVYIFDPTMQMGTIQAKLDELYKATGQFSSTRTACLFKPGSYSISDSISYYIQSYGLGMSPEDVQISGGVQALRNGTGSFWRGAENMTVTPTSGPTPGTCGWAVSQAAPFRRMHIKGQVLICNSGASGGFISDSKIDGAVSSNCAQQFYIRNTVLNGVNAGGIWNMLIQGCDNPPAENYPGGGVSVVAKTPLVREKPFLTIDNTGSYSVFVPALRKDCQGITWGSGTPAGESIPVDQFYIANAEADNAGTINAALMQGKNLLLTPGIYKIDAPIVVPRPNTVVLGLGMATLRTTKNVMAMKTADVDGLTIANLIIESDTLIESPVLLQVGDSGSVRSHSANPIFIFDLFIRSGGAVAGTCKYGAFFNSNDIVLDHCWIWRADHGSGRGWIADTNTLRNGLVINGNNCITYAQMVEHWQKYNTVWNGNNGRQYFYQHEFNYDVPDQPSFMDGTKPGITAIKVTNGVTNYEGWAIGIYSFFRKAPITVTNAMEVPKVPGVKIHHIVTYSLGSDQGEILHAVNDTGTAVKWTTATKMFRFGEYVGH